MVGLCGGGGGGLKREKSKKKMDGEVGLFGGGDGRGKERRECGEREIERESEG